MTSYIGAIDQGTTSTRFIVFDCNGAIVATAQKEHAQHTPQPGWLEHDPLEIFRNFRETAAEALIRANIRATDLAAVGITNQRETTVLWDRRTGLPLHRAIVWQDTRVDAAVAALVRAGHADMIRVKTGLPLASYFSALKLRWLLDHVDGAREKAENGDALFGTIDSWLAWNLTGLHMTDVTNASRTQLLDLRTLDWCPDLLALFKIPSACLLQSRRRRRYWARHSSNSMASPWPVCWVTSRRPSSARSAFPRARPRTPTAPAISCCSIPAPTSSKASPA